MGEFELDRRFYQALQVDRLVARLRTHWRRNGRPLSLAGSDCESPHVQRFTLSALHQMFDRHHLDVIEARGTSMLSGPVIAHLFARSKLFVRLNAAVADQVPMSLAAGWMFVLKRSSENFTTEYKDVRQTKVSK